MHRIEEISKIYSEFQTRICQTLENTDGKAIFIKDKWEKNIGSGLTCVIQNGNAIEKGGVNFSFVKGNYTPQMEQLLGEKASRYAATGISSIIHPINPHVPIIHMNVRYFAIDTGKQWFGGGIDLTPHYIDIADAKEFHIQLKAICDKYNMSFYPHFKQWADDYFYIQHRNETRGVGGIFFDRLVPNENVGFEQLLSFTTELANAYPIIYSKFVNAKRNMPFSKDQKAWQELRRGRYVEFNLVYDRGTKFGFESSGNAESILVSMPATAAWDYKYEARKDSAEFETLQLLKKNIDWVNR